MQLIAAWPVNIKIAVNVTTKRNGDLHVFYSNMWKVETLYCKSGTIRISCLAKHSHHQALASYWTDLHE